MEAQGGAPLSSQGGLWLGGDPAESPAVTTARLKKLEVQMDTTLKLLEENRAQLDRVLTSVDRLADSQNEFQSKFENLRPGRQKSKMRSKVKLTRAFESPEPSETVEASADNKDIGHSPDAVAASKFKLPPLTPAAAAGDAEGNAAAAAAAAGAAAASAPSAVADEEENSGDSDSDDEYISKSQRAKQTSSKWDR